MSLDMLIWDLEDILPMHDSCHNIFENYHVDCWQADLIVIDLFSITMIPEYEEKISTPRLYMQTETRQMIVF